MRRLPVYFLIDVSESMVGDPIRQVNEGMRYIIRELQTDPYALETVCISVIVFAGKAETIIPLIELTSFKMPDLPIGSGTSLGTALDFLMTEMDASVQKTTKEIKGDWKPLVFLFTDGTPTDDALKSIRRWNEQWRNKCNLIIISIGNYANVNLLCQLSDNVYRLSSLDDISVRSFFKWISSSVKQSSISVNVLVSDTLTLPEVTNINLEKVDKNSHFNVDENFVIICGKCSQTQDLYLLKYIKDGIQFYLDGAFKIDFISYKRLSQTSNAHKSNINSNNLVGMAVCPYCGNNDAMILCSRCNKIFCQGNRKNKFECPWCGMEGQLEYVDNLDYSRERG